MVDYNTGVSGSNTSEANGGAVYNNSLNNASVRISHVERYSDKIGTGDDAKSSVVWFVITFTLTLYACIISSMVIVDIFNNKGVNILENVKESWAVFTPIITLSLGYMFGKAEIHKQEKSTTGNEKDT